MASSRALIRATGLLLVTLTIQFAHDVEHFAQAFQHGVQGHSIKESGGILFFLNLEWNHFIFNAVYLVLLLVVAFFLFRPENRRTIAARYFGRVGLSYYLLGLFVQGYHVFEHSVRMAQYFDTGCTPCPGILGRQFDGVYLHFTFNMVVTILAAVVLVPLRPEIGSFFRGIGARLGGSSESAPAAPKAAPTPAPDPAPKRRPAKRAPVTQGRT